PACWCCSTCHSSRGAPPRPELYDPPGPKATRAPGPASNGLLARRRKEAGHGPRDAEGPLRGRERVQGFGNVTSDNALRLIVLRRGVGLALGRPARRREREREVESRRHVHTRAADDVRGRERTVAVDDHL